MKVVGIVGSPRKGGNTDVLVEAVLDGCERAGAQTEKIRLDDLEIKPQLPDADDLFGRAGRDDRCQHARPMTSCRLHRGRLRG